MSRLLGERTDSGVRAVIQQEAKPSKLTATFFRSLQSIKDSAHLDWVGWVVQRDAAPELGHNQ